MKKRLHCRTASLALIRIAVVVFVALIALLPTVPIFAADPTVATGVAADTTDSSTTLWGSVTSFGTYADTFVYLSFDYANEGYYNEHSFTYDRHTPEIAWEVADGVTDFSTTLTGLPNSTTYHYRAVVRFGNSFVYGLDAEFMTSMLEPDSVPQVKFLKAYKDLLETDDCLFVIMADIPYASIPSIPVSRAYVWSLLELGGEIGWNTGYAMNDNGYGYNVYSLYFEAADAIDWGNATDYEMVLSGSADVFYETAPIYSEVDDPDYRVYADTWVVSSDYNTKLGQDLLYIASVIEQEWQVILTDEQDTKTVLSSNGEKLFRNAIPGVQQMAPAIFFTQRSDTDFSERAWDEDLSESYKARLLGPDEMPGGGDDNWTMWGIVGLADWLNMPFLLMIGFGCLGCCVAVIYKSNQLWSTSIPGYIASLGIVICFGLLVMGLTVIALIGLGLVITAGWLLFMKRA